MLAGEFDPDPKARMSGWLIAASGLALVLIMLSAVLVLVFIWT